jgi:hypothetical protein
MIRGAVLFLGTRAFGACGSEPLPISTSGSDASTNGGFGDAGDAWTSSESPFPIASSEDASAGSSIDASSDGVGVAYGDTTAAGPLFIHAVGGPAGEVAAAVELYEPGVGPEETCTQPLIADACQLTSCREGGISDLVFGYGNFGPVSVSVGATTVLLTYSGFGYPTVNFPSSIALGEGGIMEFRGGGSGGGVPAFDVSATIPGLAAMTSPAPTPDGGSAIIDTSQDLSVTWTPILIGQVYFQLYGVIPATSPPGVGPGVGQVLVSVDCTFAGTAGTGVVPRGLLSSLKMMSGTSPTYAGLDSGLDVTTVVGGLPIVTRSAQGAPAKGGDITVTLR